MTSDGGVGTIATCPDRHLSDIPRRHWDRRLRSKPWSSGVNKGRERELHVEDGKGRVGKREGPEDRMEGVEGSGPD